MNKSELICNLYDIGCIQVGDFTLASGAQSPVYFDLRKIISHPQLLKTVSDLLWESVTSVPVELICGVPYTGLPIAAVISVSKQVPMILVRKEPKKYGLKREIEGEYHDNQSCVLIEDLVTTGGSVLKVAEMLRRNGLVVKDITVLIDREQGGKEALAEAGCRLHSVLSAKELFSELKAANKLTDNEYEKVQAFLG